MKAVIDRPFSHGFNGHAKSCDCASCARDRVGALKALWAANGKYAVPATADATVFVRSYFRRQPNHLKKRPNAQGRLRALVRSIRRLSKGY